MRAGAPVAGSHAIRPVAAGMARRRIACRQSRRVPYRLSPDRVPYGPLRRDSPSPDRVWSGVSRAVSPVAGHGVEDGRHVRYRRSPDTAWGMVVACGITRRRIACGISRRRITSISSSRAVAPVAGHGVRDGRHVPSRPSPDRVPSRPSPDHVSPCSGSYWRPLSPCRDHRLARRTPVICHAPAQHTPVADAANRCVACGFTCQYRGVLSTPVRRRG